MKGHCPEKPFRASAVQRCVAVASLLCSGDQMSIWAQLQYNLFLEIPFERLWLYLLDDFFLLLPPHLFI
jgi:hypothetical protein